MPERAGQSSAAALSDCGTFRYALERRWGDGLTVLFMMLNPSTADAEQDDPTIRRCIGFAKRLGYERLLVWNLYAYRATDPRDLDAVDDPIGPENFDYHCRLVAQANLIIAAWGAKPARGKFTNREKIMRWGPLYELPVYALGLTKDGHPRHPLYVRADAELVRWLGAGWSRPPARRGGNYE